MPAYTVKPKYSQINRGHPLAKGLGLEVPFIRDLRDYSGNKRNGSTTNAALGYGPRGRVLRHDSTSDMTTFGGSSWLSANDVTIFIGARKHDSTARQSYALAVETSVDAERCAISLPFDDFDVYWDWGGFSGSNRLNVDILATVARDSLWCFTAGPRGLEIWQDAKLLATNSTDTTRTASTGALQLGQTNAEGLFGSDLVDYWLLRIYNRQLTAREILQTQINPWRIYADEAEEDWFPTTPPPSGNSALHASLPYPIYGARWTEIIPYLDADGDPVAPTSADTQIKIDGTGDWDDTENEITDIGNGFGMLTFNAQETKCEVAAVKFGVSDPKSTLATLHPRRLVVVDTVTLATVGDGDGTFVIGPSLKIAGCFLKTVATGELEPLNEARKIMTYNRVSGAFTVAPDWENTSDLFVAGRQCEILLPEGMTLSMLETLNPTTAGNTMGVSLDGGATVNWAAILSQDAFVNLDNTRLRLHADYDLYYPDQFKLTRDQTNARDEYTVGWTLDGVPIESGITDPTIQVIKRADGTDLIAETAMSEVGSTGILKYDESTNRVSFGEAVIVYARATIDGEERLAWKVFTLDSV